MSREVLERVFAPFTDGCSNSESSEKCSKMITKVDFFEDKLTGFPNSSKKRRALCDLAELPCDMTPNALLEALNLLYGYDGYRELLARLEV